LRSRGRFGRAPARVLVGPRPVRPVAGPRRRAAFGPDFRPARARIAPATRPRAGADDPGSATGHRPGGPRRRPRPGPPPGVRTWGYPQGRRPLRPGLGWI